MEGFRERRRSARLPARFPVRYRFIPGGAASRTGTVEDLSLEGVRFRGSDFPAAHAHLRLDLIVPGHRPVQAVVEALWAHERAADGEFEIGARFVERSLEARGAIERHLRALAAHGSSL